MSKSRLCVTVTAPTMAELRRRRDAAAIDADLVEVRLDSVTDPDAAGALADRRGPVIVTCRPEWEGGSFRGAEDDRRRILGEALALGAEYVDIEGRAHFDDLLAQSNGRRVVLSHHDFDGTPEDLSGLVRTMRSSGAEVVKIAIKTRRLSDCIPLLDVSARDDAGLVLIGMGEFGLATRVLPGRFGSMWTYAGSEHHVGQVGVSTLLEDYRFRMLDDASDIYGLVGLPVSHSVSPAMHNAAFSEAGLNAVYLPFPAVSAEDAMTFARALGIKGLSVTIPHKVMLFDHMDEVSDAARRVGAINTIRAMDGRWIGDNTDIAGFLAPLGGSIALAGLRAAVLGGGGAARAAAVALASSGSRVRIHARSGEQASAIAQIASADVGPFPPERESWDLLVNCTPIGMYPRVEETPVAAADLTGRCVYDLLYNPGETRLLREARDAGCQTIGGLDMLVAQAKEQCFWWTGIRPSTAVMREAAEKRLAEFRSNENHVV